jgi:hypothetical protein
MPIHLYCLLSAIGDAVPPTGARGLRVIRFGDISAWVSDVADARLPRKKVEAIRAAVAHDAVVGSALELGETPLPATLTDAYADEASLIADVSTRIAEVESALGRISGLVEMAVIVAPSRGGSGGASEPPPNASVADAARDQPGGPGRAYLERIRDTPTLIAATADALDERLGRFAAATVRRIEDGQIGLSHLISRDAVPAYFEAARGPEPAGFRVVVDGPRAPYSFAQFSPSFGRRIDRETEA